MDDKLRDAFVQQAQVMNTSQAASAPAAPTEPAQKMEADYRAFLADNGILRLPSHRDYWTGFGSLSAVFGMLVTALLLSLGAPFWYGALARLLQLRSVLAFKEDKQRSERQATTPPAGRRRAAELSLTHVGQQAAHAACPLASAAPVQPLRGRQGLCYSWRRRLCHAADWR